MSDEEDLELQALQRQLDDAFQTTRPRAGFEDHLWAELQVRRPWWQRVRAGIAGLVGGIRRIPAAPAGAVAALLVVAIFIGVLAQGGFHLRGGGAATSAGSPFQDEKGAQHVPAVGSGSFGRLPAPAAPGSASSTYPSQSSLALNAPLYTGPATLVWAGHLSLPVSTAPVYRFYEPTAVDADKFAMALGASPTFQASGGQELARYSGDGFTLEVLASTPNSREPQYIVRITDRSRLPAPGPTPASTAASFLAAHRLSPGWPDNVTVDQSGNLVYVNYLRQFAVPGYTFAYLVDQSGTGYGLQVQLESGQPVMVTGPLPLSIESADYRIISVDQAARSAVASSTNGGGFATPPPTVRLTSAQLVYALVWAGDHSFYEPAFLFSGTFTHNGVTYVKRVLVPAVDPSQLSS